MPTWIRPTLTLLVVGLLLAGCASGTAQDARRGEQRDATHDTTLPKIQATVDAQRYRPASPGVPPTPTPAPKLESLVLTTSVGGDGSPNGEYTSVPNDAGTVYAAALLHDLRKGQEVKATWATADLSPVAEAKAIVDVDADTRWVALPLTLNGSLAPGDYAVSISVGNTSLNSLVFQVLEGGSSPRRVAELRGA